MWQLTRMLMRVKGRVAVSQSVVRLMYRADHTTCETSLAFGREAWRRYLANDVGCFVLSILEEQDEVTKSRLGFESAAGGGASSAVEDAIETVHVAIEDDD